jgi:hypothetical protein
MPRTPPSSAKAGNNKHGAAASRYLPQWLARALAASGIRRLDVAAAMSDVELLKLRGIGKVSVKMIRSASRKARRAKKSQNTKPAA